MRTPRRWVERGRERAFEHPLLTVDRVQVRPADAPDRDADHREVISLASSDWVNVVALLDEDLVGDLDQTRVVLVRQWRFATAEPTLEIPGGMVDSGESPLEAARRELLEETGYASARWRPLGSVHPNPAILTNRCHTFLASGATRRCDPAGDGGEEIEVTTRRLAEIPDAIGGGEITHSLVIAAFHLLDLSRRGPELST